MAIDWVTAGIYYALADAAGRQQATGGILALFSLTRARPTPTASPQAWPSWP
jgi:hypothetical protein